MLSVQLINQNAYTDAERTQFGEQLYTQLGGCIYLEQTKKTLLEKGTPEDKAAFNGPGGLWERLSPFLRHSDIPTPLVYDLRRAVPALSICYVNDGANDFNQADAQSGFTPSILVALKFAAELSEIKKREELLRQDSQSDADFEQKRTEDNKLNRMHCYVNDYLYIYRKLKEDPRGLNYAFIATRESKIPQERISETLKQMDAFLAIPEAERFSPKDQTSQTEQKPSFWKRLFRGRS